MTKCDAVMALFDRLEASLTATAPLAPGEAAA